MRQGSLASKLLSGKALGLQIIKHKMCLLPRRTPLRIDLNITKSCNLQCKHCYAALEIVKKVPDMSLKQVLDIIDDVYKRGCRWFRLVGGEPLLRDDIGAMIKHIKKRGMFAEISTNGLLIPKRIKELKDFDAICVSLDGDKISNDFLRGSGSYDKIIAGIEIAVKHNLRIRLHCVLCAQTLKALPHMVGLSARYKANMNFGEVAGGEDWQAQFRHMTEEDVINFYKSYVECKKKKARISNSLAVINYVLSWPWKDKIILYKEDKALIEQAKFKVIPCQLGRLYAFIDVDGNMYPCTKLWKHGINYFEHGFQKAWDYLGGLTCVSCREMSSNDLSLILAGDSAAILKGIVRFA